MQIFKLPIWKVYLLDLHERIRIYKSINKGEVTFGLRSGEWWLIKNCLIKLGRGDIVKQQNRAFIYHYFVELAESHQGNLSKAEFILATKLSPIKKLCLQELFMEIDVLKQFAIGEVGMEKKELKSLDEEDLTIEILRRVNRDGKYGNEFIEWYEALDMKYFKQAEQKGQIANPSDNGNTPDFKSIADEIDEQSGSLKKLRKICEAYNDIFPAKLIKIEDEDKLEKKMTAVLGEFEEEFNGKKEEKASTKSKKATKNDDEDDEDEEETTITAKSNKKDKNKMGKIDKDVARKLAKKIGKADDISDLKEITEDEDYSDIFEDVTLKKKDDVDKKKAEMLKVIGLGEEEDENGKSEIDPKLQKKLAKAITAADDISELKEIAGENEEFFADITLKKKDDVEEKKIEMMTAIGFEEVKASKKSKKASKDDDDDEVDVDKLMEEWEEMGIGTLKKTAKEMGLTITPDKKKVEILKMMKKAATKGGVVTKKDDDEEEEEIELTPSLIKVMLKQKDLDGLQKAAKSIKLEVSSVAMRSCNRLADALIEAFEEKGSKKSKKDDDDEEEETPKKGKKAKAEKEDKESIFDKVVAYVKEELSDKKIIKKLTDWFTDRGKDEEFAEAKIKQLIAIAKIQNGGDDD
jgi:hypothetical protein